MSASEARARLERYGPNELGEDTRPGRLAILAEQFRDVLIWILVGAASISGLLLDEWIDAGVILAIVVLNAILGYVQEARAEDALARLKEMAAPLALVLRGGDRVTVPSADVVPGDVLVLEVGDRIAA
ncbi:MAG TPA: cation-transporting P-type ATPase, partial [Acidimicrobiia bacterium]|nr:cation-transporting P-type ATPase [Acidimicrobiia bacterium]